MKRILSIIVSVILTISMCPAALADTGSNPVIYTVKALEAIDHGQVVIEKDTAEYGQYLHVTVEPETGYYINSVTIETDEGDNYSSIYGGRGDYTLKVCSNIIIHAEFKEITELQISNLSEFLAFRDEVNNGNSFKGYTVFLKNDLDLSGIDNWIPIGNTRNLFKGSFDGEGHTITGLSITSCETGSSAGLFGNVEDGELRNLTVEGSIIVKDLGYVGGISGQVSFSKISNCHNRTTVSNTSSITSNSVYTGGVTGTGSGILVGCTNEGDVTGNVYAGGIAGSFGSVLSDSSIVKCGNFGIVDSGKAAGISGIFRGSRIDSCVNKGDINSKETGYVTSNGKGYRYYSSAGIVYDSNSRLYASMLYIRNCYNTGNLYSYSGASDRSAEPYTAGILAEATYNDTSCATSVINCYNTGTLFKTGKFDSTKTRYGEILPSYQVSGNSYSGFKEVEVNPEVMLQEKCYSCSQIRELGTGAVEALGTDCFKEDKNGINEFSTPLLMWEKEEKTVVDCGLSFNIEGAEEYRILLFNEKKEMMDSLENGTFRIPSGNYSYIVSSEGFVDASGTVKLTFGDKTVDVVLKESSMVTFHLSPDQSELTVYDSRTGSPVEPVEGMSFNLVKGGIYTYNVSADGFVSVSHEFAARESEMTIDVVLSENSYDVNAPEDQYIYGSKNEGKNCRITKGGVWFIGKGAEGLLTVDTKEAVTLIGPGISDDNLYQDLYIDCVQENSDLTLKDAGICNSEGNKYNLIDFSGEGNVLRIEGTCLLDYNVGYTSSHDALIHVPFGASLTIQGSGTLYQYNCTQGAGIGGDTGEMNGQITFAMTGSAFLKGTKQGAVIGAGANAGSVKDTPGSILFQSGNYNLETNSRGAAIGGSAGTGGGSEGTVVYVKGGNININCDYTGAAIGGGGYESGNDASGGTIFITGGSLRTYIDNNAASNEYGGYNNAAFTEGVNDAVITAKRLNDQNETVYKCVVDTSDSGEGPYTVIIDGKEYYTGDRHQYCYVNEKLPKSEQYEISRTQDNWVKNEDANLYFYLTGTDHTISINGKNYQAEFDSNVLDEQGTIINSKVYTSGAFTLTEIQEQTQVDCNEYGGGFELLQYVTDTLPAAGNAYKVGDLVLTRMKSYETGECEGRYVFVGLVSSNQVPSDLKIREEAGSYETKTAASGDVNQDQKINILDAQVVHCFTKGSLSEILERISSWLDADVNDSRSVNTLDARAIQYFVHFGSFGQVS